MDGGFEPANKIPTHLGRVFQACYHCFNSPAVDAAPLKRCSHCRRVTYDSPECQKAHWKSHKGFCKAYALMRQSFAESQAPLSDEPSEDMDALAARAWERTTDKKLMLELLLGRKLTRGENNLVGWEPRCLSCARTEEDIRDAAGENASSVKPLMPCPDCRLSFYCSEAHRDFARHKHENAPDADSAAGLTQCAINKTVREDCIVREILRKDRSTPTAWVPRRVKARWESLEGKTWKSEYERELPTPPRGVGVSPLLRHTSDSLTHPLTILWGLEKLHKDDAWTRKDTLTIHVLGSSDKEVVQGVMFEEILHCLPKVKTLRILLCGPDMDFMGEDADGEDVPMDTCPRCTRAGRKRVHVHVAEVYHGWVDWQGDEYTPPDLAIAFNSGIGSQETESWLPTAKLLVKNKIPSLFTAFNRAEVAVDRKVLEDAGAHLVPGLEGPNPWGSQLINAEPNRLDNFYAGNLFIAGGFFGA